MLRGGKREVRGEEEEEREEREEEEEQSGGRTGGSGGGIEGAARLTMNLPLLLCLLSTAALSGVEAVFWDGGLLENVVGSTINNCSARTPPNNTVFPVNCTFFNEMNQDVVCSSVSFSVVWSNDGPGQIAFTTLSPDYFAVTSCELPDGSTPDSCGMNYQQKCAESDKYWLTKATSPLCGQRICNNVTSSCTCNNAQYLCTCYNWKRYTVKPVRFLPIDSTILCFTTTSRTGVTDKRCVFFDIMVQPYKLTVSNVNDPNNVQKQVNAYIGEQLDLTVFAQDVNTEQSLSIRLQPSVSVYQPSTELPNQQWLSATTTCLDSNNFLASTGQPCKNGLWFRKLTYSPRLSEIGMQYSLYFEVSDDGFAARQFDKYVGLSSLSGTTCGKSV